jgi:hypothetical protein
VKGRGYALRLLELFPCETVVPEENRRREGRKERKRKKGEERERERE